MNYALRTPGSKYFAGCVTVTPPSLRLVAAAATAATAAPAVAAAYGRWKILENYTIRK